MYLNKNSAKMQFTCRKLFKFTLPLPSSQTLSIYNIFFILFITDFLLQFNRLHVLPNACIKWFDFSTFDNIKTTLVYLLYFHDFLRALWSIRLLGMYLSSWSHKWPPAFRKNRLEHTSSKSIIYVLWRTQSSKSIIYVLWFS